MGLRTGPRKSAFTATAKFDPSGFVPTYQSVQGNQA
jgi:hypothetical protein